MDLSSLAAWAKRDPADFCNHMGVALYDLKRYEEALQAHEQAIRLEPNNADFHYNKEGWK